MGSGSQNYERAVRIPDSDLRRCSHRDKQVYYEISTGQFNIKHFYMYMFTSWI